MVFTSEQHRLIAKLLRGKARKAPDLIVVAQLLRLADQHEGMARYLDKHPDRYCPVVTVEAPSIAP
jgi:hypothetical protein